MTDPQPDPGNSPPGDWTTDLTHQELVDIEALLVELGKFHGL